MPLAVPTNLRLTASSYSTLRVSWDAAPGATQYMILYSALSNGEPEDALEVRAALPRLAPCVCDDPLAPLVSLQEKLDADRSALDLSDLQPATDYSVTLYALYDEDPSDPVTAVAATRERSRKHASERGCRSGPAGRWRLCC